MWEQFNNHKHLKYFVLYAASYLAYGTHIAGLGPLIPYLSEATGLIQTEYSFLFSCRSFAMVVGALIVKELQKRKVSHHNITIAGSVFMFIFSLLFSYSLSSFWLGFWLFMASMAYTFLEISINVCIILINNPEELNFWLLLAHGVFGIGGLTGPFIVYFFERNSFAVMGLLTAITIPFYMRTPSPQVSGFVPEHISSPKTKAKTISTTLEYSLCTLMFLYIGLECTYGGWISSFAVLTNVTDNRGATLYPSLFWIVMTIFRFSFAFINGNSSDKLKILIGANILSGIISLLIIHAGHAQMACLLSAAMFGLSMSSIYPLILSFPIDGGLNIEDSQTTNIVMAGVISEGMLTMLVGWFMEWIHVNMLFYSLTLFAVLMYILRIYCLRLIQEQRLNLRDSQLGIELKETPKQDDW